MSSIFQGIFKKSIASEVAHKGGVAKHSKAAFLLRCGCRFKVVGNGLVLPKLMAQRRNKGGCAAKGLCVYSFFKSQKQGQTFIPSILCNTMIGEVYRGCCRYLKKVCHQTDRLNLGCEV